MKLALTITMAAVLVAPRAATLRADEQCDEFGVAAYAAVQDETDVTVFANGVHRTGGFANCLTIGPEDVHPPILEFRIKRPTGGSPAVVTPFTAKTSFESETPVEFVKVRDARGLHRVRVVQLRTAPVAATDSSLCQVVSKGRVGETGIVSRVHHQVTGGREVMMVLRNTESSLCPNTGAVAMLIVNGKPASTGDITQKNASIQANVNPGDHVYALVATVDLFNGIVCVRLGNLSYTLEQCDLE